MQSSFIDDYMLLTEGNESPKEYHIWSMLYTLSVFAGRRFWFPFGPINFYPHLYVILVGDPGITKTSAMNRALHIIRASEVCPIAGTRVTKEALMKRMSTDKFPGKKTFPWKDQVIEYNQYAIFASELVDFLGMEPQSYLDFFTACWDQPVIDNDTKHQGQDIIVGPYITLLGCMTPDKLNGFMKMSILGGGFARRVCFMYASAGQRAPWPSFTPEQKAAEERCIEFGKNLQNYCGEFRLTPECKTFYDDVWYDDNLRTWGDAPTHMKGWYKSKGELLFKVSMLVNLATACDLQITLAQYKLALAYCKLVEVKLDRVFEGHGKNPNADVAAQICRMLESLEKPMPRKKLEAMFFAHATSINELRDTLSHMIAVGRLEEKSITHQGQFLGSVIAAPGVIAKHSDLHLAVILGHGVKPVTATQTDSSSSARPSSQPGE